jgi:carboxypeptidase C (cathepsin A)
VAIAPCLAGGYSRLWNTHTQKEAIMSADPAPAENANDKKPAEPKAPPPAVETRHRLVAGRRKLDYPASIGALPIKNAETDEVEAYIHYTAYTLGDKPDPQRPLTFVFNGGPGSASIWLHLGALGPRRVQMQDEGWMPAPPFRLVENPHTWLDVTDLVFVDPVGTGYSRATKAEHNKKFWSVKGDTESLGEFIRLYLTRFQRWASPLFMAGESYGTFRSAGLMSHLLGRGIAFNGVLLISTVLNMQTLDFARGNDLPYSLFLPTYTATAWYHKKLPADLQAKPLREVLAEAEAFARRDYVVALAQGDALPAREKAAVVRKLARYTGLSATYIEQARLRVVIYRYCKELLRDQGKTVGRLDSRFTGLDAQDVNEFPEFDPSYTAILPPYTAMMNHYARSVLGYEIDTAYEALSFKVNQEWEWKRESYDDTSEALRQALAQNPYLKVFVAQGYYDLATPHLAAEYTFAHMDMPAAARDNIHIHYYEAGHMMYLDSACLAQLKDDAAAFLAAALPKA